MTWASWKMADSLKMWSEDFLFGIWLSKQWPKWYHLKAKGWKYFTCRDLLISETHSTQHWFRGPLQRDQMLLELRQMLHLFHSQARLSWCCSSKQLQARSEWDTLNYFSQMQNQAEFQIISPPGQWFGIQIINRPGQWFGIHATQPSPSGDGFSMMAGNGPRREERLRIMQGFSHPSWVPIHHSCTAHLLPPSHSCGEKRMGIRKGIVSAIGMQLQILLEPEPNSGDPKVEFKMTETQR